MNRERRGYSRKIVFVSILLLAIGASPSIVGETRGSAPIDLNDPIIKETMKEKMISLSSSHFIQNMGQIDSDEVMFISCGGEVFFTPSGVTYWFKEMEPIQDEDTTQDDIPDPMKDTPKAYREWGVVLKFTFLGANGVIPEGNERCSWNTNYFKGSDPDKWYTEVPNYKEVIYPNLWDGIDLVYRLKDGAFKYDLIIHPGADPSQIGFGIEGNTDLAVNEEGDLVICTEYWDILDTGLLAFYSDDQEEEVICGFKITGPKTFGFDLEPYDISRVTVIDPSLKYSTFIGGSMHERGAGFAIDSSGNAYITGTTRNATTLYPTTSGAYDTSFNGNPWNDDDAFVTKLNSAGSSLVYSTFLGGSGADSGRGIAIDSSGIAYLTGATGSKNYPTTSGAYDTSQNDLMDVFVTKLNAAGSSLVYSTLIGGSGYDEGNKIAIDSSGNAYITGFSDDYSKTTPYPTTSGAYDTSHNGMKDVVVTKLNAAGSSLVYSTFLGGSSSDVSYGIVIDTSGNAYITGGTNDYTTDYPTTSGAYDTSNDGKNDVFVTKLSSDGSSLVYSTFIGGSDEDQGYGITIDSSGNAYITGYTFYHPLTCTSIYPTTSGAYDTSHNGAEDVVVTKLNSAGSSLIFSTFLGGDSGDYGRAIAIDSAGSVYITGDTFAYTTAYPTTPGAYDTTYNGNVDVFMTKLNSTGSSLVYSTLIGEMNDDYGRGIAIDSSGEPYITGGSYDDKTDYPTTSGAYDTSHNGNEDVFVTKHILDQVKPTFKDNTATTGTTGDLFVFSTKVEDSYPGVDKVTVEYWYGSGAHTNVTMTETYTGSMIYSKNVTNPSDSIAPLHYIFHAADGGNNWGVTSPKTVTIIDNDVPIMTADNTPLSGTTGDQLSFHAVITDNIGVNSTYVEYWYGSGAHTNVSMSGSNPYTYTITNPSNSTEDLHYIFHANDTSDHWNQTIERIVNVNDNDGPVFNEDHTSPEGTTGDPFAFRVDVTDNIEVIDVDVEYWYGKGTHTIATMAFDGNYTYDILIPGGSIEDMQYVFQAVDSSNNAIMSKEKKVVIIDNDRPLFINDRTPLQGTTGDQFTFMVNVTDNIGLSSICVEYWFGSGASINQSMTVSESSTVTITLPFDSIETLYYLFHFADGSGNWNQTVQKDVQILDDDRPVFMEDITLTKGKIGKDFHFNINVTDNIEISEVHVDYWYDNSSHQNVTMDEEGEGIWSVEIEIVPYVTELHYFFSAMDGSDNWALTDVTTVEIEPSLIAAINDTSANEIGTGEEFAWVIDVITDSIDFTVVAEYWFGDGERSIIDLEPVEGRFGSSISIPTDSLDPLHYTIAIKDDLGGNVTAAMREVTILDTIPPTVEPIGNVTIDAGDSVNVTIVANDNIGIDDIEWTGSPIAVNGSALKGIIEDEGTYKITVKVIDAAGNSAEISFSIDVLANEPLNDTDGDGMPNSWETGHGLDPNSAADANNDTDKDGLTNLEEFQEGTNPNKADSDNDGMPDGWEISYGFDPTKGSANDDPDGDKRSNLQEYLDGTNPLNKDIQPDEEKSTGWIIIIVLMVLAVIIIGIILFFVFRKKTDASGIDEENREDIIIGPEPSSLEPTSEESVLTSETTESAPQPPEMDEVLDDMENSRESDEDTVVDPDHHEDPVSDL